MFNIGPLELMVILIVALVVVGPKRLPEVGKTIGKSLREFRKATDEVRSSFDFNLDDDPEPEPPPRAKHVETLPDADEFPARHVETIPEADEIPTHRFDGFEEPDDGPALLDGHGAAPDTLPAPGAPEGSDASEVLEVPEDPEYHRPSSPAEDVPPPPSTEPE
jgi:TatA/E family protein of Tat protein translocase